MSRAFLSSRRLIAHLLWLLLFYFCFRIAFFSFNASYFPDLTSGRLIGLLFKGMRFDISAICIVNVPFIFLLLLPIDLLRYRLYNLVLKIVFYVCNILVILFEIADWMYFPFNHKRSTAEVLDIVSTKGDFFNLIPGFFKDYWYLFLLAVVSLFLLGFTYNITARHFQRKEALKKVLGENTAHFSWKNLIIRLVVFVIGSGLTVIGIRGGLQYVPIGIRSAITMTSSKYTPIVLNTPFSIIQSIGSSQLPLVHYMPEKEAIAEVHPIKDYAEKNQGFKPDNVVLIILESFSKEFTGLTPGRSYTPFLDSLMTKSLTFTNAFANGLHSAEGIPAIVAGIPSLMDGYYTLSRYNNNSIDAFPHLLKRMGYHTAFYHGGTNGTMGFDDFASAAGYDHYYGRKEYNNDKDYDGNWGIYDEPFLQYFAKGLDTLQQPFMASVFTVTSHPPYPLPDKYKGKFPTGDLSIYPCVGYTDMSVRKFFDAIKDKPWFKHTLFIISPDHCSPMASNDYYASGTGRYQIPIMFYAPGDSTMLGYNHTLMQQIDILPSVMDYLHYPDSFFCLGNSVFRNATPRFVITQLGSVYDWINAGKQSFLIGDSVLKSYAFPQDSLQLHNLVKRKNREHLDVQSIQFFRAFVQLYNQTMVKNEMTVANLDKSLKSPKIKSKKD